MAAIGDMSWTSSEELFRDLDLDDLYERQVRTICADRCTTYPYRLLVFTGKITIGISMGNGAEPRRYPGPYDNGEISVEREDGSFPWNP